jgi:hypothetical protein
LAIEENATQTTKKAKKFVGEASLATQKLATASHSLAPRKTQLQVKKKMKRCLKIGR